ncbi:hypothetical protein M0805_008752 [Coniferiporia weirii]|nr:hypothetical protein M0805_008752 [Coniferiporia weirii]
MGEFDAIRRDQTRLPLLSPCLQFEQGNSAFKAGNYPEAVGHYSAAILADGTDPTLPLNRAAAYLKLGKNVDAERDCSNVLHLRPGHVKALYRRAQARIELEKLDEAKKDLLDALKIEPNNSAVKTELEKVDEGVRKRASKRTAPKDIASTSKPSVPRRRVPIEIVESSSPSNAGDSLTPISSRPLISKHERTLPTQVSSPARLSPSEKTSESSDKAGEHQKTAPSARGGIFRPSGEHTLFRAPSKSSPSSPSISSSKPAAPLASEKDSPQPSPLSLFDLNRSWELASSSERWDLLCNIPPEALPSLFKTSLEATLLVQILEVCALATSSTGDPAIKDRVRGYLRWFPRVPRFSTVALFLSKQEKEIASLLAETVGAEAWRI